MNVFPQYHSGRYSPKEDSLLLLGLFNNPQLEQPTEIEITDPMHPLFGRKFEIISLSYSGQGLGNAIVKYQGQMRLRIPLSATQLTPKRRYLGTKITRDSVSELVNLASQCEVLCLSHQDKSGNVCPQNDKTKLSMNSSPSSRR